jgi:hypothetical protein
MPRLRKPPPLDLLAALKGCQRITPRPSGRVLAISPVPYSMLAPLTGQAQAQIQDIVQTSRPPPAVTPEAAVYYPIVELEPAGAPTAPGAS